MTAYRVEVSTSRLRVLGQEGDVLGSRQLAEDDINALVEGIEGDYRVTRAQFAPKQLQELGRRLHDWLEDSTLRWLASARKQSQGLTVHLAVDTNADALKRLRHLPWELVNDGKAFLCPVLAHPLTLVRRVGKAHADAIAPANRPLRVLFMACSPENVKPVLRFEDEEARILEVTRGEQIELIVEESGTLRGLADRINWHRRDEEDRAFFDVLHLTGHAKASDPPHFLMEDDFGEPAKVTADEIADALGRNWPRFVFLSGCETGKPADEGAVPSMCEALVAAGAPAVLGWALPVADPTATVAATELYEKLGGGEPIDAAVSYARAKLFQNQSPYWHVLRMFADATEPAALVTPAGRPGASRLRSGTPTRSSSRQDQRARSVRAKISSAVVV